MQVPPVEPDPITYMVPSREEYQAAVQELMNVQQEEKLLDDMLHEVSTALESLANDKSYE